MTSPAPLGSAIEQAGAALEVRLLGMVDFDAALFLQERLLYEISGRDDLFGGLLLCEHPPAITIGREGSLSQVRAAPEELTARQVDVRWINRGGGCLVHAPGQLAVYPLLPLDRLELGLAAYRNLLEDCAVDACRDLCLACSRRPDEPGVWCRTGKVAHIGVAVKSWVSYHGMFINVCPALDWLRLVEPEAPGDRVSSLACERARPVSMHAVRTKLIESFAARLGYERYHIYTGHPLLTRTKRRVHVPA